MSRACRASSSSMSMLSICVASRSSISRPISWRAEPSRRTFASGGPRQSASARRRNSTPSSGGARVADEPLELEQIDRVSVHVDAVSRHLRSDRVAAERAAEGVDVAGNELLGRRRRSLAPQLVHEPRGGDDLARVDEQHAEQRPRLWTTDRHPTLLVANLDRAEDPEVHPSPFRENGVTLALPQTGIHHSSNKPQPASPKVRCTTTDPKGETMFRPPHLTTHFHRRRLAVVIAAVSALAA